MQASTNAGAFALDLSVVRDVQAVLDFQPDRQPFAIEGTYALDFREKESSWNADLGGTFALAGTYDDGVLRHTNLTAANLHLSELKPASSAE